MWFASSLIDLKIRDISEKYVGKVTDLLFSPKISDYPKIEYLVIKCADNSTKFLNCEEITTITPNNNLTFPYKAKNIRFEKIDPDNFASIRDSVLDQQIVDLKNAHVIRVSDVRLGFIRGELKMLGVDISFKGILRRLGLRNFSFFGLLQPIFIDLQEIQILKGKSIKVNTMMQKLKKLHPADLADIIERINSQEREKILDSLEEKTVARVIEEADEEARQKIISSTTKEELKEIFENMDTDDVVDVIQDLPQHLQQKVTSTFDADTKQEVDKLSTYKEDTVGGLMTTEFIEVPIDWSVAQTIDHVKKVADEFRSILYLYVVDSSEKLQGSVSMRALICADKNARLRDIFKQIPTHSLLDPSQSIDEIIAVMTKYNLYNAAVADEHGNMIGLVSIDDVLRVLNPDV